MYSDAERVLAAEVTVRRRGATAAKRLEDRYNISSMAQFIATGRRADGELFKKVAVQFPDDLLHESVEVLAMIADRSRKARSSLHDPAASSLPLEFFALADNTFGSCCPDEVTAKHYHADAIVHLGYACYSQSSSLPVFNDAPSWTMDFGLVRDAAERHFSDGAEQVVLLFHPGIQNLVDAIAADVAPAVLGDSFDGPSLSSSGSYYEFRRAGGDSARHLVVSEAITAPPSDATRQSLVQPGDAPEWCINGATFPRFAKQRFVFAGPAEAPQLHQLVMVAMHNASFDGPDVETALRVVPVDEAGVAPELDAVTGGVESSMKVVKQRIRQRMFNIEHVKAASVVGIVVASLGIANFRETAERMREVLIRNGKRAYVIYIGHLNQYKLANFVDSVDCFCVIACPNSRIAHFHSKQDGIVKPLVSPVEVAIALGLADFMTSAAFTTRFDTMLNVKAKAGDGEDGDDEDGAAAADGSNGALITTRPLNVAVAGTSALQRLNERSYVGLDPKIGQTAVQAELAHGREGIAKGYAVEEAAQDTKAGAKDAKPPAPATSS